VVRLRRHPLIIDFSLENRVNTLFSERNLHLVISPCDETQPLFLLI
jgi:hypothetical protein